MSTASSTPGTHPVIIIGLCRANGVTQWVTSPSGNGDEWGNESRQLTVGGAAVWGGGTRTFPGFTR